MHYIGDDKSPAFRHLYSMGGYKKRQDTAGESSESCKYAEWTGGSLREGKADRPGAVYPGKVQTERMDLTSRY